MNSSGQICMVPHLTGAGGPAVFQRKFTACLKARGFEVTYDINARPVRSILVVGGTRQLVRLMGARRAGIPVVQRLNGMNWIHRRRRTGLKHYLRAEYGNLILSTIRRRLADRIIYQSAFARTWWETENGPLSTPTHVVHNGVDLSLFTPQGQAAVPKEHWRVLVVEGNLAGGYDLGLEHAVELVKRLNQAADRPVELVVAGNVPPDVQSKLSDKVNFPIQWKGHLPQREIPALDRSAHLLFSADVNAACPNSVIEALACGLPVLALDSGALPELVNDAAGIMVSYGGDPWRLDPPNYAGLVEAGLKLLHKQDRYRTGARTLAESNFGLDRMVERYLKVL